jgi:2,4-dienoyl-CoA reductase-like NADH-dependent reductase (Old Yellow Enzyme family)
LAFLTWSKSHGVNALAHVVFEPFKIGDVEAKNRLVRSATSERLADEKGRPSDELRSLYAILCRGGMGTIMTGHTYVRADGKSNAFMTGADSDENIPSLAQLAKSVHAYDVPIFVQLNHAGAFAAADAVLKRICVSQPTPPTSGKTDAGALYELSTQEVHEVIEAFVAAAGRVEEAGFDGVQLHCAHGYLIGQFLSRRTNRRSDEFGGSLENRTRFVRTIVEKIVARKSSHFLVGVKWNCEDFVEGGLSAAESLAALEMLITAGVLFVEISGGVGDSVQTILRKDISKPEHEAYFLPNALPFRRKFRLPTGLVGGIRSIDTAESVIRQGFDFVSLSRPLIRQPDLPARFLKREKVSCVSCNRCLISKKRGLFCRRPPD